MEFIYILFLFLICKFNGGIKLNTKSYKLLEFDIVKEKLKSYAVSELGKKAVERLEPSYDINIISAWMEETTETRNILDITSGPQLGGLDGITDVMGKLGKSPVLMPEELTKVYKLLETGIKVKRYMSSKAGIAPMISSYASSISSLDDAAGEINRCIRGDMVDDNASGTLSKIRKKIAIVEERIKSKLESILRSSAFKDYIQDSVVSIKGGRYVIPVKKEYRKNIEGNILDASQSGSTVFIEPAGVSKLHDELNSLKNDEEKEIYNILSYLSGLVDSYHKEISVNIEALTHYDFLFAKGKYSRSMSGRAVKLNENGYIKIIQGCHPLIEKDAVPLDFEIGRDYRVLIITGPNTGGKTVALKTVGLLTMMVQSGLHVSCSEGSEFSVYKDILADIGDGQSIAESLSTFSSHIKNIISIIECADPKTLVIMDEIGAGTDPAEGTGLAQSILEHIYKQGATILTTTHYGDLKNLADTHEGFKNGCMEFDIKTLKPLYRLKIGKFGESNAFLIALRLGMRKDIIERAHEITYKEKKNYDGFDFENKPVDEGVMQDHIDTEQKIKSPQDRKKADKQVKSLFKLGDCVYIGSLKCTGIVCETENAKGEIGVMVKKRKVTVNKKRLSLYVDGKDLYPEDYDYDIVFESKENRKKKHMLDRKHVDGLVVEIEKERDDK